MSTYRDALTKFEENMNLTISTNPLEYNLNAGLADMAEALERDMNEIKRALELILNKIKP